MSSRNFYARDMARKLRIQQEARMDRQAEELRAEWKEDQRDEEFIRYDRSY